MMLVAEKINKPTLKVSMSVSDTSSEEESDVSENEASSSGEDDKADAVNSTSENHASSSEEDDKDDAESITSQDVVDSSEEDAEADIESDLSDANPDALSTNEGWADSVAKILGSNKPKNKKTLVLSRAKKHSEIAKSENKEKPSFEVIGEDTEKPDVKKEVPSTEGSSEPPVKKVKLEKPSIRLKPNVLEKDRERLLSKIATKGVVQLFNAVRNQQKTLEKDLDRTDLTEGKKQKILKNFDKRTFLDTLMGKTKSVIVDQETKTLKNEVKPEDDKPKWSALRDDFMMGAKMKDWDKESVDE